MGCGRYPMTDGEIFMHVTPNEELCKDGEPHKWEGWIDFRSEDGKYITGGSRVCSKCGLDAMTHSLRYGP
jgi:hypothetical protein